MTEHGQQVQDDVCGACASDPYIGRVHARTAKVTVLEPCDCGPCVAGRRWFECQRLPERRVVEYTCDCLDGTELVPSVESVQWVMGQHPGKVYLHVGFPKHLEAEVYGPRTAGVA